MRRPRVDLFDGTMGLLLIGLAILLAVSFARGLALLGASEPVSRALGGLLGSAAAAAIWWIAKLTGGMPAPADRVLVPSPLRGVLAATGDPLAFELEITNTGEHPVLCQLDGGYYEVRLWAATGHCLTPEPRGGRGIWAAGYGFAELGGGATAHIEVRPKLYKLVPGALDAAVEADCVSLLTPGRFWLPGWLHDSGLMAALDLATERIALRPTGERPADVAV